MSCTSPVLIPFPRGFRPRGATVHDRMMVPCGRCLACSLARSEQWSVRCQHEASYHAENCFLTLTYRDENLPSNTGDFPTLCPPHVTEFFRRLRDYMKRNGLGQFRYLYCGEYGSLTERPHYHVLMFGYRPSDLVQYSRTPRGDILYTSEIMDFHWRLGHVMIGDLTPASAAYTCRYTIKKQSDGHQKYLDRGQYPPFIRMSRRPGIGRRFYDDYFDDLFNRDFVVIDNETKPIPNYYKKLFKSYDPLNYETIFQSKIYSHLRDPISNLEARRRILEARTQSLSRGL